MSCLLNNNFIPDIKTVVCDLFACQTVKQYGGVDILVSNAAANPTFGPILEVRLTLFIIGGGGGGGGRGEKNFLFLGCLMSQQNIKYISGTGSAQTDLHATKLR